MLYILLQYLRPSRTEWNLDKSNEQMKKFELSNNSGRTALEREVN